MNTTEYRNLTEQVLKNKEDILKHFQRDEILADFGIKIIGQLVNTDELYAIPTEGLEYGDAYAVGTQSPFNYYIWTRANNISPVDYWFNFGQIAIVGPAGPRGLTGPKGNTGESSRWFDYTYIQNNPNADYNNGDMALAKDGNVYMYNQGQWAILTNIKGPIGSTGATGPRGPQGETGPQGPKGATGDVGGFINIAGIIADEYSLPDPTLVANLTVGYLVGTATPYDLYIQVGSTSASAQWFNAGPLNVATMVTVGGQYQNIWDADTKVNKKVGGAANSIVYGQLYNGEEWYYTIDGSGKYLDTIPTYRPSKADSTKYVLRSFYEPAADDDLSNKKYVDKQYAKLLTKIEYLEAKLTISFYINSTEYKAAPDMTWEEFVRSAFNDGYCYIRNNRVYYYDNVEITDLIGTPVSVSGLIQANGEYVTYEA